MWSYGASNVNQVSFFLKKVFRGFVVSFWTVSDFFVSQDRFRYFFKQTQFDFEIHFRMPCSTSCCFTNSNRFAKPARPGSWTGRGEAGKCFCSLWGVFYFLFKKMCLVALIILVSV